ncbi:hypothetical protein RN001_014514 [Aquatica leii]|uniref:CCHC-type domain-containing protein n=1 Tax=Aquatica leii TaxID=1421715 RepID=A0AAN7NUM1_9COLE|nr:hypothetical protein RN001_014514 [Aquatica leii]
MSSDEEVYSTPVTQGRIIKKRKYANEESGEDDEKVLISPRGNANFLGEIRALQTEGGIQASEINYELKKLEAFIKENRNVHTAIKEKVKSLIKGFYKIENNRQLIDNKWEKYTKGLKVSSIATTRKHREEGTNSGETIEEFIGKRMYKDTATSPMEDKSRYIEMGTSPMVPSQAEKKGAYSDPKMYQNSATSPIRMEAEEMGVASKRGLYTEAIGMKKRTKTVTIDRKVATDMESGKETDATDTKEWRTINKKRERAEAVLIKLNKEDNYEEVLKRIRSTDIDGIGTKIEGISRSREGDIIMKVEKGLGKAEPLRARIAAAIADKQVKTLRNETTIEIKDLDMITTEREILQAIISKHNEARARIKKIFRVSRGQQVAIVYVDKQSAQKLEQEGHILIGWTSCRIRIKEEVSRCFRCWAPGHRAETCKGEDRSTSCYKCEEKDHQIKDCGKEDYCTVCETVEKDAGQGHRTFGRKCKYLELTRKKNNKEQKQTLTNNA